MTEADGEIEAVARALCKRDGLDPDARPTGYTFNGGFTAVNPLVVRIPPRWEAYVAAARVACTASRLYRIEREIESMSDLP